MLIRGKDNDCLQYAKENREMMLLLGMYAWLSNEYNIINKEAGKGRSDLYQIGEHDKEGAMLCQVKEKVEHPSSTFRYFLCISLFVSFLCFAFILYICLSASAYAVSSDLRSFVLKQ